MPKDHRLRKARRLFALSLYASVFWSGLTPSSVLNGQDEIQTQDSVDNTNGSADSSGGAGALSSLPDDPTTPQFSDQGQAAGLGSPSSSSTAATSTGENASSAGVKPQNAILGDLKNFQTDAFTGRLAYSVPLNLPPARANSTPRVALTYNSANECGWCGMGWALDMGSIERDTRRGVPVLRNGSNAPSAYDSAMGFTVSLNGKSGRLVALSDGTYRYQIEGDFVHFNMVGDGTAGWSATDKAGNIYLFGPTSASQNANPAFQTGGSAVFRWALQKVTDANGNYSILTYSKNLGHLYLSRIDYNGNANFPPTFSVIFTLEPNGDTSNNHYPSSARSGFLDQTAQRLSAINVLDAGINVHTYGFFYTQSNLTGRSLLTRIRHEARGTSTPDVTFSYQQKSTAGLGFANPVDWGPVNTQSYASNSDLARVRYDVVDTLFHRQATMAELLDIDRDGLPDRVMKEFSSKPNCFKVQRNTGTGFSSTLYSWGNFKIVGSSDPVAISYGSSPSTQFDTRYNYNLYLYGNTARELVDINGDGLPDFITSINQPLVSTIYDWNVLPSTGHTGTTALANQFLLGPLLRPYLRETESGTNASNTIADLIDVNGDGLLDEIAQFTDGGSLNPTQGKPVYVRLNKGSGFTGGDPLIFKGLTGIYSTEKFNLSEGPALQTVSGLFDMNADGLPDLVAVNGANHFVVYPSNGFGLQQAGSGYGVLDYGPVQKTADATDGSDLGKLQAKLHGVTVNGATQSTLADINGDGLLDRVVSNNSDHFTVWFNCGSGFSATSAMYSNVQSCGQNDRDGGRAIEGLTAC